MFYSQLECNSPKNKFRQISQQVSEPFYHLTIKKLSKMQIYYDDVVINKKKVAKMILLGKIVQYSKGVSPRGMAIIKIKVQDTTDCTQLFYYFSPLVLDRIVQAYQCQLYVTMAVQVKVSGLVYRPQIQLSGISIRIITDFNELTLHYLSCFKMNFSKYQELKKGKLKKKEYFKRKLVHYFDKKCGQVQTL